MPEMKWTRNVRIEGCGRAGARPQELRLPRAPAQAQRKEPLLGSELEESPDESKSQGTVIPTKRTRQSACASQRRSGFECSWLYPWRGREVCHFILPREQKVEHLCDAVVSRREMANGAARSSIGGNPAQAIILKCDCNAEHTHQDPASHGLPPILYSMACHRRGASLVACRADPCDRPVDRPTD